MTKIDEALHNSADAAKKLTETVAVCARCGGRHTDALYRPLTNPQVIKAPAVVTHFTPCPNTGQPLFRMTAASPQLVADSDALATPAGADPEKERLREQLAGSAAELADSKKANESLAASNGTLAASNRQLQEAIDSAAPTRHDAAGGGAEYRELCAALGVADTGKPADAFRNAAAKLAECRLLAGTHADQVADLARERDEWKSLAEAATPAPAGEAKAKKR